MAPPRRTQAERREATRAKLVQATITSLAENGYAATSAKAVLTRADVSVGGMYRHFPTLLDLIVAAADEVRARQFDEFRKGLAALATQSVEETIELLRAACRKPINGAWYDLLVAARTDAELRERLTPFTQRYHQESLDLARSLPVVEGWEPDAFAAAIFSVVHMLDGEALSATVHDQSELEPLRTAMLAAMLRGEPPPGRRANQP